MSQAWKSSSTQQLGLGPLHPKAPCTPFRGKACVDHGDRCSAACWGAQTTGEMAEQTGSSPMFAIFVLSLLSLALIPYTIYHFTSQSESEDVVKPWQVRAVKLSIQERKHVRLEAFCAVVISGCQHLVMRCGCCALFRGNSSVCRACFLGYPTQWCFVP